MAAAELICGGCGLRLRTSNREIARRRRCPRCRASLVAALESEPGLRSGELVLRLAPSRPRRWSGAPILVGFVLLVVAATWTITQRDDPVPSLSIEVGVAPAPRSPRPTVPRTSASAPARPEAIAARG